MTADALSHKFRRLAGFAGVQNPALHRLRHGVATHPVDQGKLLEAQARLGHRDPSTMLRHYSHATPLDDEDIADELDAVLSGGQWPMSRAFVPYSDQPSRFSRVVS
jgi:integrase